MDTVEAQESSACLIEADPRTKRKRQRETREMLQHASLARSDFLQPLYVDLTRNTPSTYSTRESLMCACTHVIRKNPANWLSVSAICRESGRASELGALSTDLPNSFTANDRACSQSSARALPVKWMDIVYPYVIHEGTTRARVETLKSSCSFPLY